MSNVTKRFKELLVIDGINLEVEACEGFGLLGPNGAGQTTLLQNLGYPTTAADEIRKRVFYAGTFRK